MGKILGALCPFGCNDYPITGNGIITYFRHDDLLNLR
jgi:hypothetical protein